ncbi:polycystin-1-like protein 2 [Ptychodera flava]|uniref:polycystin-1-like protein 2 n=1 Tax=Ptychodera flava TaxID=63121 RepID=UPI00396A134E
MGGISCVVWREAYLLLFFILCIQTFCCHGCVIQNDTDYFGGDIGGIWTNDSAECCSVCWNMTNCGAFTFVPNSEAWANCWLKFTADFASAAHGLVSGAIERLNLPPRGGYCQVNPSSGSALLDTFVASCHDWKDGKNMTSVEHACYCLDEIDGNTDGLTYELRARDLSSTDIGRFVHRGTNSTVYLRLPCGAEETSHNVELIYKIYDVYGAYAVSTTTVQVLDDELNDKNLLLLQTMVSDLAAEINAGNLTSADISAVLHEIDVITCTLNKWVKNQTAISMETIQQLRESLMDISRPAFSISTQDSVFVEQAAQALVGITSVTSFEELLPETQVTGTEFIDEVIVMLSQIPNTIDNYKPLVVKITTDIFHAVSNVIETRQHLLIQDGRPLSCSETDVRLTNTLFGALDSCLDETLSILDSPDSVGYTSPIIQASVTRCDQDGFCDRHLTSTAGGFILPSRQAGNSEPVAFSKFMGSMVNPHQCNSPEELTRLPVVDLEIFDLSGQPVKMADMITVNVTKVNSSIPQAKYLEVSSGNTVEFSFDVTGPVQIVKVFLQSNVTGMQYDMTRPGDAKSRRRIVSSGSVQTLGYLNTSNEQSYSFQLDIAENGTTHTLAVALSYSACVYWNKTNRRWQSDGCWPDLDRSTDEYLICQCNHLTSFTAADFVVPVNKIDFTTVFNAGVENSILVLVTLTVLLLIYILLVILMRKKDKQDLLNWRSAPQAFNSVDESYYYRITVFTGLRPGAGTANEVALQLFNDDDKSRIIRLVDTNKRLRLTTGSVRSFLVSTRDHLEGIKSVEIRLLGEKGADDGKWFLDSIEVVDMLTKDRYHFFHYKWIREGAVGEGAVQTISVSDEKTMVTYAHLFTSHLRVQIFDEYLWGSLISRQMPSNFTRVQRLSCCMAILCLAMISNAMFYGTEDDVQATKSVNIGSSAFSFGTVYVALISSLITIPASSAMVALFKKSARNLKIVPSTSVQTAGTPTDDQNAGTEKSPSRKSRCFGITAWILVVLSSSASIFFVILYSRQWGPVISRQWFITECTSLFLSAFIVDPSKAFLVALVISFLYKLRKLPFQSEPDDIYREGTAVQGSQK